MIGVIHEADDPKGLVQKCKRCGTVLSDYTNAMSIGSEWKPCWWNGFVTVYSGNPTQYVAGEQEDAKLCIRTLIRLPFSPDDLKWDGEDSDEGKVQ